MYPLMMLIFLWCVSGFLALCMPRLEIVSLAAKATLPGLMPVLPEWDDWKDIIVRFNPIAFGIVSLGTIICWLMEFRKPMFKQKKKIAREIYKLRELQRKIGYEDNIVEKLSRFEAIYQKIVADQEEIKAKNEALKLEKKVLKIRQRQEWQALKSQHLVERAGQTLDDISKNVEEELKLLNQGKNEIERKIENYTIERNLVGTLIE